MKINRLLRFLLIFVVLCSNIACDRISKHAVRQSIENNESIPVIGQYLTLTRVENTGAFLSFGEALPKIIKLIFLTIFPLVAVVLALVYILIRYDLPIMRLIGICTIIGGGIGNLYDRTLYVSVTDFLHIDFVIFQTGIFNMADVSVLMGFLLLFLEYYSKKAPLDSALTETGISSR